MTNTCAIVVAGGSGSRFGARNKTFSSLLGRPMVSWSLDAFQQSNSVSSIVLVAAVNTFELAHSLHRSGNWSKLSQIAQGGKRRQDSVCNGLKVVSPDSDVVAIHDAARPLVRTSDIDRCIDRAMTTGAAILATPVTDTLKRGDREFVGGTVPREDLWAAQTPQVFGRDQLILAFNEAERQHLTVTDDAALFELLGFPVAIVEGSPENIKITVASDLVVAEAILKAR